MNASVALVTAFLFLSASRATQAGPLVLDIDTQLGWIEGRHSGGVDVGATARVRFHVLTAGMSLQGATALFTSMGSASAVGGVAVPVGFLRFDALAELGINAYTGVGSNFLSDDPGTGATLPFAGARVAALARVHRRENDASVWIGPSVHYAEDLRSTTSTYSYRDESQDWSTGEYSNEWVTESARIGQSRWSVLAVLAVTAPLWD